MTDQQELPAGIYSSKTIYRPPFEKSSVPLEVCQGCSWGKCKFCDFAKDKFCVNSNERIEHDLHVLASYFPEAERVFFLGENTFCLPTEKLASIIEMTKQIMPNVKSFAMYSRIDDIERKSDEELAFLRYCGVDTLHIGIESGCDDVLSDMNKGITSNQAVKQLGRLDNSRVFYHITIVLGLGGKQYSRFHALQTAQLINKIRPVSVWCLKLHLYEGTPLFNENKAGRFDQLTPVEVLQEERLMLKNITTATFFTDTTVLDQYTLAGLLPEKKQDILDAMDLLIKRGY